jgi:hypothetical protein
VYPKLKVGKQCMVLHGIRESDAKAGKNVVVVLQIGANIYWESVREEFLWLCKTDGFEINHR